VPQEREARPYDDSAWFGYILLGSTNHIDRLLGKGVDVNTTNSFGVTGLHFAVMHSSTNVVHFLLSKGANPNIPDRRGNTPVFTACQLRRADCMIALLESGAITDGRNMLGESLFDQLEKNFQVLPKPEWARRLDLKANEQRIRKLLQHGSGGEVQDAH
jgi:ankyrin repeat protein